MLAHASKEEILEYLHIKNRASIDTVVDMELTAEKKRLLAYHERKANWKNWGPYLSERAWGTVREDYSAYGTAWDYLPHDHARSRAYRWDEDGLAGISDRFQYLCFALALWNGRDPILKERLFGLNGHEGNHGEDVKEQYFYLDNIPTHCYMKMLYKYPQRAYPYADLVAENGRRGFEDFEYELLDSGIFEEDGFFYDVLHLPDETILPLKVRSLVGLIPLLAVETLEPELLQSMPDFTRRMHWFTDKRPDLSGNMASIDVTGAGKRIMTSILTPDRLVRVLQYMLDEEEFLSPFGIRSISKQYEHHPYILHIGNETFSIRYDPAESRSSLFGGNSNWRGPIWFPINYLIIESLRKFYHYCGDDLKVECPTGSGRMMTLAEVAQELSRQLVRLFLPDENGRRPVYGGQTQVQEDPYWRDHILFYEYFHGDNGAGLGASHQTGWTSLVANLLQWTLERPLQPGRE